MYGVELYRDVRLAVVEDGLSEREAARRFGIDRRTVKKMLRYSAPPGYRRTQPVRRPKLEDFTGFIDAIPTFKFDWQGQAERLHIFFEGDNDSTLVVRTPDGSYACNDDYQGSRNMNPRVEIVPKPGEYIVYVGSFSPSEVVSGTLTITEDVNAEPAVLTSDMLDEGE